MKKWGLFLMLFAMLAVPMLACGFPLPAGSSMMAVSKAVCAEGEAADSCQARQDAYQMMSKLQAVVVEGLDMALVVDDGTTVTNAIVTGSFEYQVAEATEGLGANLRAKLEQGEMTADTGDVSLSNTEFIIVGNKGYTSRDGGETWVYEELDANALLGLGLLLGIGGVTGAGLDLFSDPAIFTVTAGADVEMGGQTMHVQTLTLDLAKLLSNGEALAAMMETGFAASGESLGLSQEDLGGVDAAQIAMMSAMLLPVFTGSEFSTTIYIGADDGYIHRVEDTYLLNMDMSSMGQEGKITMSYILSGDITQHNAPLAITAPEDASEGAGLLGEEGGLFGGGLGGSVFGGQ
ncbi:MAG: hypothetical protein HY866_05055 [Chloroflexi bacterium]|nr:hypothetical protein [Chloroflexota bacterium]